MRALGRDSSREWVVAVERVPARWTLGGLPLSRARTLGSGVARSGGRAVPVDGRYRYSRGVVRGLKSGVRDGPPLRLDDIGAAAKQAAPQLHRPRFAVGHALDLEDTFTAAEPQE